MTKVLFEHKKGPLIICAGMSMTVPIFCEKNFTRALRSTAKEQTLRCSEMSRVFRPFPSLFRHDVSDKKCCCEGIDGYPRMIWEETLFIDSNYKKIMLVL
ncbi:MAG: hypothetical protein IKT09_00505 [Synergistes sp.]|nr:hypothetical protein [Synergistes sp.]